MSDCIFCKIIQGEIPSTKVFESKDLVAFLDIMPANKGHTLIVPKKHFDDLESADPKILAEMTKLAQKISKAVLEFCDGTNIVINNKPAAGQIINHMHMHVIPRHSENNFKFDWPHRKYEDDINLYSEKIKKSLQ